MVWIHPLLVRLQRVGVVELSEGVAAIGGVEGVLVVFEEAEHKVVRFVTCHAQAGVCYFSREARFDPGVVIGLEPAGAAC